MLRNGLITSIAIIADHVPPVPRHGAYTVWLYGPNARAKMLGIVNPGPDAHGRMHTTGSLPANASTYTTIIVSIETRATPRAPTEIVLRGPLTLR